MSGYGQRRSAGAGVPGRLVAASAIGLAVLALVTAASGVSASREVSAPSGVSVPAVPASSDGARRPDARPSRPAPYIQAFAGQPGVPREAATPSASAGYSGAAGADACDHEYGNPGQCVPWSFPPGVTDRCAWLAAHGFGPLAVVGRDRQRLDTNHDGVACGPGDA